MWSYRLAILLGGIVLILFAGQAIAQEKNELVVGTKAAAPFVIKGADGTFTGISIELWQDIADRLQYTFTFEERDIQGLIDGLADGSLDASIAAITVTAEREEIIDFSHPYHSTGLSIAVSPSGTKSWTHALQRLFSAQFLQVIVLLGLILLAVGILIWLFERKRNTEQFGGSSAEGIGSGFWWSAVTMTTVGYGDKAPQTFMGRLLGLVWMFAGIIIISGFTAAITTSLTVTQLESSISGPEDLPRVRVGTVSGSASEIYLQERNIDGIDFATVPEGLQAIVDDRIDAMVYDAPILRYLANTDYKGKITVLPDRFNRQDYGIGLPVDSDLREAVNRVLLEEISSPDWQKVLDRYLGAK